MDIYYVRDIKAISRISIDNKAFLDLNTLFKSIIYVGAVSDYLID